MSDALGAATIQAKTGVETGACDEDDVRKTLRIDCNVALCVDVCEAPLVSVIVPCHNGASWLEASLESVRLQTHRPLELSFWDDASTDGSAALLAAAGHRLEAAGVCLVAGASDLRGGPIGCGGAKNRAILQSHGAFLCFLDADDTMRPDRVALQLALMRRQSVEHCLVGSAVAREPVDAQPRYTKWLNSLTTEHQLRLQRFKECTLSMTTWFCGRTLFDKVGSFSEAGPGTPEDLDWFYRHLRLDEARLARVPEPLVTYRSHEGQASRGVSVDSIWALRVGEIQHGLLDGLEAFSIWSAGRDGKRLYRSLKPENRVKVKAFLDVDAKKLSGGGYFDKERRFHVPILSWTCAAEACHQPAIICVKSGLHDGFEENLASLQLKEGKHYWHFN